MALPSQQIQEINNEPELRLLDAILLHSRCLGSSQNQVVGAFYLYVEPNPKTHGDNSSCSQDLAPPKPVAVSEF